MEKLQFNITIDATAKKVWDTMLHPKTYKQWVNVSWPGSIYEGTWSKGEKIRFLAPDHGGTMATLDEFKPYETILARHVAVLSANGSEDHSSAEAKGWIGTTERYSFAEAKGKTTVTVTIETSPKWASMFRDGWPAALNALKEISEK